MNCSRGEEQSSSLPLSLPLPLMNGPGGWIVQSVLYLHQTVKPLPLLIICHNFTEHTLRPKGSPCPAACPFPPLSGRALSGQGARGRGGSRRGKLSSAAARPLPPRLPREPPPEGPCPPVGDSPAAEPGHSLPAAGGEAGCAHDSRGRASRKHPRKFAASSARFLVPGDMRPGGGKPPVFPGQTEEKQLRRDPACSSNNRFSSVFRSDTEKSPFSLGYFHFEQMHLPAAMSAPLLYTVKNNSQN